MHVKFGRVDRAISPAPLGTMYATTSSKLIGNVGAVLFFV